MIFVCFLFYICTGILFGGWNTCWTSKNLWPNSFYFTSTFYMYTCNAIWSYQMKHKWGPFTVDSESISGFVSFKTILNRNTVQKFRFLNFNQNYIMLFIKIGSKWGEGGICFCHHYDCFITCLSLHRGGGLTLSPY